MQNVQCWEPSRNMVGNHQSSGLLCKQHSPAFEYLQNKDSTSFCTPVMPCRDLSFCVCTTQTKPSQSLSITSLDKKAVFLWRLRRTRYRRAFEDINMHPSLLKPQYIKPQDSAVHGKNNNYWNASPSPRQGSRLRLNAHILPTLKCSTVVLFLGQ